MDTWVRPRPGRGGYRADFYLALLLAAAAGITAALYTRIGLFAEPAPLWLTCVVIAGYTLPLALRRRFPLAVALVVSTAFLTGSQVGVPEALFNNIALFLSIYTVGAWTQNRRAANIVRGVIVTAMFLWVFVNIALSVSDPETMPGFSRSGLFSQLAAFAVIQIITNVLYFVAAWVFGNAGWASARLRAELEARGAELLAEREFSADQAVALDRVRIARELHDVVAHHVSVMGLQAGAARRLVETDPVQASASLEHIEQSARSAVDEMHRLLVTLRDGDVDSASTSASTRGVAQLDELVRDAGLAAEFRVVGAEQPLSSLVGFTLYRVAQEALTNVRKHASAGAAVDVRLRYQSDEVELEVVNTGRPRRGADGFGLGQLGMRERIDAVGGAIEFRRRDRGGYLVRATIPLESA